MDCFAESAPVSQVQAGPREPSQTAAKPAEKAEPTETATKPEAKPPAKKALPKKPWLKPKKKPGKSYNLDFLDNLDDPNFNPFETKTAVINKFEDSSPVKPSAETPADIEVNNVSADAAPVAAEKPKEVKKKPTKTMPPKPWLKKKATKPVVEEVKNEIEEVAEDEVKVPSKGYNLDFLDNLDDPNFNPFETKTAVVDKFEDSSLPTENKITNVVTQEEPKVEIP